MSFSFRNLFAQDENGNPLTGDRTEGSSESDNPGVQEYGVSELLPFIPPAIVAQTGIPMDKSIQIILPEDGSNDVRLSTIYQSCPSLFAAEITPLNDSVVNLPPKPELAPASPPLAGNPFGNEMEFQSKTRATETMTEDRTTPPALPETEQATENTNSDFGFSPPLQEVSQTNGNPFSGTPEEIENSEAVESPAPDTSEAPESTPSAVNPFSDLPDSQASPESPFETDSDSESISGNPFSEQGQPVSSFFSAPAEAVENPFENTTPSEGQTTSEVPANQEEDSGEVVFGTDSDSFATLFSEAAQEDRDISVSGPSVEEDGPSVEFMLNEGNSEYVGPSMDSSDSPFAGMDGDKDENLGFESFIPPNMQDESPAEPSPANEETETIPIVQMGFAPLPTGDEVSPPAENSDQGMMEPPVIESPEIKEEALAIEEEAPAIQAEMPEPFAQPAVNQIEEKVEDAELPLTEQKVESVEPFQEKPEESAVKEPESVPEAEEEIPAPQENNDTDTDKNEEILPKLTESEMEKEKEEDRNVLATALLESGVLMTPSGYRIQDPNPTEAPQVRPEPVPFVSERVEIPLAEPKQEAAPVVPSSRHLPVTPAAQSTPSSHPFASTGPAMHDIELRAVFATEDSFTLTKVAQRITEMDGVVACAIVTPQDVIENFSDPADAIGHKTKDLAEHVRCLASVTGVEGASYFTLHMDKVIMSFFFGDNHLLGVKHAPDAFKPGGREKLVLVARSLEGLQK